MSYSTLINLANAYNSYYTIITITLTAHNLYTFYFVCYKEVGLIIVLNTQCKPISKNIKIFMYLLFIKMLFCVSMFLVYDIILNSSMLTSLLNCIYLTLILLKIIKCTTIYSYMYILLLSKTLIFIFNVFTIKMAHTIKSMCHSLYSHCLAIHIFCIQTIISAKSYQTT